MDLFGEHLRLFFSIMASSASVNDTISRLVLLENAHFLFEEDRLSPLVQ